MDDHSRSSTIVRLGPQTIATRRMRMVLVFSECWSSTLLRTGKMINLENQRPDASNHIKG
jgi:hypothetical protein